MDKPTQEEIVNHVKEFSHYKPIQILESDKIESFTLIFKTKIGATSACNVINRKYGSWVYAMVHDQWKNPHVSVGYRSKELK